ncbi:MAG TPA: hypothetical protein VFV37_11105 [Luteibaculaceae bacterium]|nr:hypothetical protein [Luteibaculaceae bacterium]
MNPADVKNQLEGLLNNAKAVAASISVITKDSLKGMSEEEKQELAKQFEQRQVPQHIKTMLDNINQMKSKYGAVANKP